MTSSQEKLTDQELAISLIRSSLRCITSLLVSVALQLQTSSVIAQGVLIQLPV